MAERAARASSTLGRNPSIDTEAASAQDARGAAILEEEELPTPSTPPQLAAANGPANAPIAFELQLTPKSMAIAEDGTGNLGLSGSVEAAGRGPKAGEPSGRGVEHSPAASAGQRSATAETSGDTSDAPSGYSQEQSGGTEGDRNPARNSRPHAAGAGAGDAAEPGAGQGPASMSALPTVSQPTPDAIGSVPTTAPPPSASASSPSHSADAAPTAEAAGAATSAGAAANDIRVEVPTESGKIDVRIMERGGDLHVSVRTADNHLAGNLREGLPALSARLEESGFRSEAWRPGAGSERRTEAPPDARSLPSGQQSGDPNRGRQQQQPQQQDQRNASKRPNKNERNDFAWLFTSIR
jgi:hypothetical protein